MEEREWNTSRIVHTIGKRRTPLSMGDIQRKRNVVSESPVDFCNERR